LTEAGYIVVDSAIDMAQALKIAERQAALSTWHGRQSITRPKWDRGCGRIAPPPGYSIAFRLGKSRWGYADSCYAFAPRRF